MLLFHSVVVVLSLALAPLQDDGRCSSCSGVGRLPCPDHRSAEYARESNALVCTFYAGCTRCAGTGSIDCASCDPVEDEAGQTLRRQRAEATARLAEYEKALGRPLLAAASAHFNLVLELEPARVEGKKRGRHELLHLYLDRLEAVRRAYREFFALGEEDLPGRSEVFLWTTRGDHEKAGQEYCGYTTTDVEYKRGLATITSLWLDPQKMKDDEALHRNVVHQVVHGLMDVQAPADFTGILKMGWADEGLSLWFEDRLLGAATGYCYWPEPEPPGMRTGHLRPTARKLLELGKKLEFERLLTLDTVQMTRDEQALGFALIDFLAARDPAKLNLLLARLRARTPSRDAFMEVYTWTLEQLEAAWREWVAQKYPSR